MKIIGTVLALVLLVTPSYAQVLTQTPNFSSVDTQVLSAAPTQADTAKAIDLGVTINTFKGKSPGTSGRYAVVDKDANVVNMVDWDGVTDYIMPCQPCTFVPFAKLTKDQSASWTARAPVVTEPTTSAGINCVGAPTANFTVANGKIVRC